MTPPAPDDLAVRRERWPRRARHALEGAFAACLVAAVRALPFGVALGLAAAAGRAVARLHGPRMRVARKNMELALPEVGARERRRLLADAYANLGRLGVEALWLDRWTATDVARRVRIEGREHLDAARAASPTGGALLLTAHFGSMELCTAALAHAGLPITVAHRSIANPRIEARVVRWRARAGIEVLRGSAGSRGMLRAAKAGRLVVVRLDQNAHRREGVFAPFFGISACTDDRPARLAMQLGVPVVPVFLFRESPGGATHTLRIGRPLDLVRDLADGPSTEAAVVENVGRMNSVLEAAIRRAPAHWIWVHKRWRTRPDGEPRLYRRRRRMR